MKILFVTATRIGDAVLSTGLLRYLIERYPGAQLTIAAGPLAAPLFAEVPGLVRVIAVEKKAGKLHWPALYAQVVGTHWDLAVDLRGSALTYLLWARQRRVMGKGNAAEHRVRQLARLFDCEPPPAPTLWLGAHHRATAERLVPPGAPVLVVGPAANWSRKEWRAARFAELAARLTAPNGPLPGARIVVLAAAHERAQA
ncbi:MAG: glycosyltransferase family 9 protein, partial [Stellaceae bacterium]